MWDIYAKCPECGKRYKADFGSKFHIHLEVCKRCGTPKSQWTLDTERWVSKSIWYKPSTWGTGHWETRGNK